MQKTLTPEEVCLQESSNAAELRLAELGIEDVDLFLLEAWLKRMQALKEYRRFRLGCATRLAALHKRDATLGPSLDRLTKVLKDDIRRLSERVRVGQFIFENVAKAPWNTTEAFVRSHLLRDGLGRMELQGICDPSGRGEGYAFLRIINDRHPGGPVNPSRKPKSEGALVGTDKDLRKLTKEDAINLLVKMGEDPGGLFLFDWVFLLFDSRP